VLTARTVSPWRDELFTSNAARPGLRLIDRRGRAEVVPIPVGRWHGVPDREEMEVLARAQGPVLDVGCGPGRHVRALIEKSVPAVGIDVSLAAVRAARRRLAPAIKVSVFGAVPGAGNWMTLLLLDGNIGIGGDPVRLLRRCHDLLDPQGMVLAELDPPDVPAGRFHARVEHAGQVGPGFPWARVGPGQMGGVAAQAGFDVNDIWEAGGRWFVQLDC
jgi:SAM-dependent methyltransferase